VPRPPFPKRERVFSLFTVFDFFEGISFFRLIVAVPRSRRIYSPPPPTETFLSLVGTAQRNLQVLLYSLPSRKMVSLLP